MTSTVSFNSHFLKEVSRWQCTIDIQSLLLNHEGIMNHWIRRTKCNNRDIVLPFDVISKQNYLYLMFSNESLEETSNTDILLQYSTQLVFGIRRSI